MALIPYTGSMAGMYSYEDIWRRTSTIAKLPPQLLAQILQHLSTEERLETAAVVCSAWKTAAIMATDDICVCYCPPATCSSLSAWLQAHSVLAAVRKLDLCRDEDPDPDEQAQESQLQLPALQLRDLQELSLMDLHVTAAPNSAASSLAPNSSNSPCSSAGSLPADAVLNPALQALTSLRLHGCSMSLAGLETLTGLRGLAYTPCMEPLHSMQAANTALARALPQLQHLTSLQLHGAAACDAVLLSIGSCTRLKELALHEACCSAEGLQQLPTSLEQLLLCWGEAQPDSGVKISPSTTSCLCQLAALQHMQISGPGAQSIDTAVLDGLTSLTSIALSPQRFTASPGQYRFQVLAAQKLPRLSQVMLCSKCMDVWRAEEGAALTAAAQSSLTALHLRGAMLTLDKPTYAAMCPVGVQLRGLQSLMIGVELLGYPDVVHQLVSCCVNLTSPTFCNPEGADNAVAEAAAAARSLRALTRLECLQQLHVFDSALEFQREAYEALAQLPHSVEDLQLSLRQNYSLDGLLNLTSCQGLCSLHVVYYHDEDEISSSLAVTKACDCCATNVWQLLPRKLSEAADALASRDQTHAALYCCVRTIQAIAAIELGMLQHKVQVQSADQRHLEEAVQKQLNQLQERCKQRLAAQEQDYQSQLGSVCRRLKASQRQVTDLQQRVSHMEAQHVLMQHQQQEQKHPGTQQQAALLDTDQHQDQRDEQLQGQQDAGDGQQQQQQQQRHVADQQQLALLQRVALLQREVTELRPLKQEVAALKAALEAVLGRKL